MKKLLLILLILFPVSLFAGYGSDVDHALEMENNVTDIGNNPGTWVNGFSVPFDATTFKYGSYSAGVFPATGSISVTLTAQEKTFQIWYYMKTGSIINGQPLMKIMNIGAGNYCTLYFFGTTVGMYIPGYGEIDDSPTMDAWHIAKIIFTGSKVQYWSDGTKRGEYNHATYPNSNLFFIGNSETGAVGFGGYIDRVIISSSDASAGNEITPIVGSPTFTPTLTITNTLTASPTLTITPTISQSPTFTPTFTITKSWTLTMSPTFTISPTVTQTCGLCVVQEQWTQNTAAAPFEKRQFSSSVVYNGHLWEIGGANADDLGVLPPEGLIMYADAWYTDDGINWTAATRNAAFGGLRRQAVVVFDAGTGSKMWLIGGIDIGGTWTKKVWNSSDGVTWNLVTANAAFGHRAGHQCVVFNGYIYLISGQDQDGTYNPQNDVWRSNNGVDWTCLTKNAEFNGRSGFTAWVYHNSIFISGGAGAGGATDDTWVSNDGIFWTRIDYTVDPALRSGLWEHLGSTVYDDKFWLFYGSHGNPGVDQDYAQWSTTGLWPWTYALGGYGNRGAACVQTYNNRIYIVGGVDLENTSSPAPKNDVWSMGYQQFCWSATPTVTQTNSPTFTPTYTPTFTPTFTVTPTFTITDTVTQTVTQTITPTYTVTPTFTVTPTTTPQWNISISAASNYIILGQAAVITLYGDFTGNSVASLAYEWEGNPKPNPTYVPTRISQASGTDEDGINARWDFFGNDNGAVINGYFSITVSATAFITTSRSLDVGFMSFLGGKEIDYGPELEMTFVVVSATPTPTITPTPYANPNLTTDSTTMILGHSATINLFGVLSGNFLFSEEDFNSSSIYFNEISAVPTAGYDWNYYNQGPKNGTYYEPITITVMPILQGNTTIYGEYDTKLSNGSNFQVFNSLNITIVTETPTYTPTFDTPTQTPIVSPTFTNTPIIINTSTITPSPTQSPTFTITSTATNTFTPTPNFTHTFTPTVSPTYTISPTPIIVTVLPITSTQTSVCTESYLLSGALEYVIEFLPTGYEMHVPVWKNIFGNPFYFEYIVQLSGIPNRSKITGLEIFVKKSNPQTGAWVLQGPNPIWACL